MLRTKLTLYLKSRVVMEPRFGSRDDGLTIYVQRSAPLIDDVILTVTSQFDNRLGRTKKKLINDVQKYSLSSRNGRALLTDALQKPSLNSYT